MSSTTPRTEPALPTDAASPADTADPAPGSKASWGRPFLRFGIICSLFGPGLLVLMWIVAWAAGDVDPQAWASWESNHGPWSHRYGLSAMFEYTLKMPILGSLIASPALFSDRRGATVALLWGNVIFEVFTAVGHIWLFD